MKNNTVQVPEQHYFFDHTGQGLIQFCCPNEAAAMGIIVVSLADSICRHPDVTLESGLVPHTIRELFSRYKLKCKSIFKVTVPNKIHYFAPCAV